MLQKRILRTILKVLSGIFLGWAITESCLPFLGFAWHATHSGSVILEKWKIQVPSSYFVSKSSNSIAFITITPVLPFYSSPSPIANNFGKLSTINVSVHDQEKLFDVKKDNVQINQYFTNSANSEGLSFQTNRKRNTSLGQMFCFQFGNTNMTSITCILNNSNLTISYRGIPEHSDDVYTAIQDITLSTSSH